MSHRHHAIDYVELAAPHQQTARSFYSQAFGWVDCFMHQGPRYAPSSLAVHDQPVPGPTRDQDEKVQCAPITSRCQTPT